MSILNSIKSRFVTKLTSKEFYQGCEVEKVQWWLSYCHEYPDLFWARLRKFSNGKVDVLFQDEGISYGFDNEEFAGYFISEDEFSKFENIDKKDRNDFKIPEGVLIETPDWKNKEVIDLKYLGTY